MAMSVGADDDELVTTINTTPLVDVMLVLLIIFLITIPVATKTVPVELPKEVNQPRVTKPENINIAIDRTGQVYWNEHLVAGKAELVDALKAEAVKVPQPEVQVRGDAEVRYESVGQVVFAAQRAGIQKLGFITQPPARGQ